MAHLLYVADKEDIITSSGSLTPTSSGEVSVYKNWLQTKLHRTINRGAKLRKIKGVATSQPKELKLIDVKTSNRKKASVALTKAKVVNKKPTQNEKCSTRIVQLAAPSKRHCIATWRQRADKLSPEMLDRLKMYVNDELPAIKVSDAINSFQRRRKLIKRVKKVEHKTANDNLQTKKLCVKFGNKIALQLLRPNNISLKNEWQRISEEVNTEISKLMKTCVKLNNFNRKMNEEIANKVTVWMADILYNAENVLLERDLKDLDEQEGPLLDFIEDIIDEAVKKIAKVDIKNIDEKLEVESNIKHSSIKDESIIPSVIEGDAAIYEDKIKENNEINSQMSSEDLLLEINESSFEYRPRTDSTIPVHNELYGAENIFAISYNNEQTNSNAIENIENTTTEEKSIEGSAKLSTHTNSIVTGIYQKDNDEHATSVPLKNSVIENVNKTNNYIENKITNDNNLEINENISEVRMDLNERDTDASIEIDAPNEKLSETGINVNDEVHEYPNRRAPTLSRLHISMKKITESFASFQGKKIQFASPKGELLTEADEDWPSDLNMLTIKSSYSATKSVTSLENIYENEDEKIVSPQIFSSDEEEQ